jgi:hypothetical protein
MWTVDEPAEQLMRSIGIEFEYRRNIPIASLNVEKSKRLNARFNNPIDEDQCQTYAFKMKAGVSFPCLVLHEDLILAGNNRTHAAILAGRTHVDAYVILKATPQQIDIFTRRDNTRHGLSLTKEELIQQCVDRHLKYDTPLSELNQEYFGGNQGTYELIKAAVATQKVADKLKAKAIDIGRLTTRASLAPLYRFRDNANVLTSLGQVVVEFNLPQTQVKDLADKVYEGQTEEARLSIVSQFRKSRNTETTTGKVAPESKLKRELNSFHKYITQEETTLAIFSDKKERTAYLTKITEIIDALRNIKAK